MNNIRKFFGMGDLFIKAGSETLIDDTIYQKGDIIAFFENVQVGLGYNLEHKTARSIATDLSNVIIQPNSLIVSNVKNTAELDKLYYPHPGAEAIKFHVVEKHKNADGEIFIKNDLIPAKVKVYNNGKIVESEHFKDKNSVKFEGKYDELDLLLEFEENAKVLGFEKPELGYLEIEATVEGKFGDKSGYFNLKVPKVDLVSEPETAITDDSSYHTSLSFMIIDDKTGTPTLNFIRCQE